MALAVNTHWDLRTSGADTNGGAFVPGSGGTDFSQQDAPNSSGTLGTATGTTAFQDVGHAFTSSEVGNILQIASGAGFTAGFYQVISVTTGVATLDRSPGTGTVAVWALGGGLKTLAVVVAAMVSSNVAWVKSGTYTITAAQVITFTTSGGNSFGGAGPTIFEGYGSTHGDLGTKPLITTATNSINLVSLEGAGYLVFRNLSFSSTAGTRGDGFSAASVANSTNVAFDRCLFDGFNRAIYADWQIEFALQGLLLTRCEVKNSVSHAVVNTYSTQMVACYIHNNGGAGFSPGTNTAQTISAIYAFIGTVFYANSYGWDSNSLNLTAGGARIIFINSVFSDSTNDGIRLFASGSVLLLDILMLNCIFYANGGYGVNSPNSGSNLGFQRAAAGNAYGANVTAPSLNWIAADITLSGDPFAARTSGNFALNNTAGAGASCRAAGFPGVSPAGTGFLDVGALQHQDAGGGGTTYVIAPTVNNFIQE